MYLLLCISVNIGVVHRERAWLLTQALSLYIEREWFLRSDMVFVQRKGMAFRVRHGLCTETGHGLLVQAWSFYTTQSSTVMFSFLPGFPPLLLFSQNLLNAVDLNYYIRILRPSADWVIISVFGNLCKHIKLKGALWLRAHENPSAHVQGGHFFYFHFPRLFPDFSLTSNNFPWLLDVALWQNRRSSSWPEKW